MTKTAIIGAVDLYGWDKIKHWANSIKQSGFTGDVHLICFRVGQDVLDKAKEYGFQIWQVERDNFGRIPEHNVMGRDTISHQLRFWAIWSLLQITEQYKFVIITDVRDVIFQENPTDWLERSRVGFYTTNETILAPSEGILFKNEPWNTANLAAAFGPVVAGVLQNKLVTNVGTIAGRHFEMQELALTIYLMGIGHQIPNDQAAFNVLIHGMLKERTQLAFMKDGWAAQCGTTLDPEKSHLFSLLEEAQPVVKNDQVFTSEGKLFQLVHQWDRVPELVAPFNERYGK